MYNFSPEEINNIREQYLVNKISTHSLAKQLKVDNSVIVRILNKLKIKRRNLSESHKKYNLNINFFNSIDSEQKSYILGFIIADGYVYRNTLQITIHKKDIDILEKTRTAMESSNVIHMYKDPYVRIEMSSPILIKDLLKYGVISGKSAKVYAPLLMENVQRHFWRGVLDGDGEISPTLVTLTGTEKLCNDFKDWLYNKNIYSHIYKTNTLYKDTNSYIYRTIISTQVNIKQLILLLYYNSTIYSNNKFLIFEKIFQNNKFSNYKNHNVTTNIINKSSQYNGILD